MMETSLTHPRTHHAVAPDLTGHEFTIFITLGASLCLPESGPVAAAVRPALTVVRDKPINLHSLR